jgi:putative transposase
MNAPKCTAADYIDFLVASPRAVSGTEAARVQPPRARPPAHDAFTRLLHRLEPDPATLWGEAAPLVDRGRGILVLDDSTLDKPYARRIGLVTRHWSGKHQRVVQGINLLTLLWTDGDALIPTDYRLYDKAGDGLTKNDHFRAMLVTAQQRAFHPALVAFDGWYASLDNLKAVRAAGWHWLTRLKGNRLVTPEGGSKRPLADCAIAEEGTHVQLHGYGFIRVFRFVAPDGDTEHWATSDLAMDDLRRVQYAEWAWGIEEYHRGLKQHCGVERAQVRAVRAQRTHIGCAIRAFLRLEWHRQTTGIGWWEAKTGIVREAVRAYLAAPCYTLPPPATA